MQNDKPLNSSVTPTSQLTTGQQISTPLLKFFIGFIAGICAASFPRLSASLAVSDTDGGIVLFNTGYIAISLAFSVLVGLIVMIMEWKVAREPRATFMMAIGLPALITGSLNTTTGVSAAKDQANTNQELVRQLAEFADIETLPTSELEPLSFNGIPANQFQKNDNTFTWTELIGIKTALASPPVVADNDYKLNPGIKINEPKYYVIIGEFEKKESALQKVEALRSVSKGVLAVKSANRYLVLYSNKPTTYSDAVLTSLKLKKEFEIKAKIMKAE